MLFVGNKSVKKLSFHPPPFSWCGSANAVYIILSCCERPPENLVFEIASNINIKGKQKVTRGDWWNQFGFGRGNSSFWGGDLTAGILIACEHMWTYHQVLRESLFCSIRCFWSLQKPESLLYNLRHGYLLAFLTLISLSVKTTAGLMPWADLEQVSYPVLLCFSLCW